MTRREYIKELLSHVRSIGSLPGELEKSLPSPEEGSKGQEAAVKVVSNPYFLAARKRDGAWYARVESELEDFAARIDAMLNPTEDSINEEIRQFLEELLNRNLGTDLKPGPQEKQEQEEEEEEDNEENDENVDKEREDADSGEQNKIPDDINDLLEDLMKSIGRPDTGNEEDEEKEKENETDNEEQFGIGAGNSKEENLRRENRFLRSIPKDLLKLAKLIGRSGSVDFKPSGHFPTAAKSDITGITIGDNLSSLLPSETALLSCPATQPTFYHNYVEKRLQIFASASSGNAPVTHQDGPVIICLDTSGSMRGEKVEIACNLTMAITIIAQRRKRDVLVVKYSDWHFLLKVTKLSRQREDLEKFLSSYQGCGNAENELFRWLFKDILPNEKAFDTADILCITDFGWRPLNDYTTKLIESFKRKGMIFYGLNVLGFEKWSFDSMTTVCDSLWKWSSNHLEEMNTQKKGTQK
ncbi:MAG: hypothetical protein SPK08_07725 [Candidatus Cryptobacteroides sp.]|nr:hypothetical protein [Rikenellaceae bacterium]MDY5747402.1 hypothetical protein [Candidatus Cryptobacteroides sp.]